MKNAQPLSPDQKKAKEIYNAEVVPGIIIGTILLAVVWFSIIALLRRFHLFVEVSSVPVPMIGTILGHAWALSRVRKSGFSQESKVSETILKTATQFTGEPVEWYFSKKMNGWMAFFYLIVAAATWWLWHSPHSGLQYVIGIVGFILSVGLCLTSLLFLRVPLLRLDESGIMNGQNPWRRKRIYWSEIASCEITKSTSFSGEATSRVFVFKDDAGRKLLAFSPLDLLLTPYDGLAEIEADVRRRMTA
ncbi:hypothetical protein EON80_12510 [bacterium]|nr:MAG: hypothetical protein EON80_12510 [bacterium]